VQIIFNVLKIFHHFCFGKNTQNKSNVEILFR